MFGNVFLGSVFKGLTPLRDSIWREVQKRSMLKCISFQTEHITAYPEKIRKEISDAIEQSDFFIILVGPQYGTKISDTGLPPDRNREDWELSFGHWELELALERLTSIVKFGSTVPATDPFKRLLLVDLAAKGTPSPELRKLREFASRGAARLGVPFDPLRVKSTRTEGSEAHYIVASTESDTWEAKLRGFLTRANDLAEKLVRAKALSEFKIDRKKNIHVAGWSGIEQHKLYEALIGDGYENDSFSFLTMDRSLIEVPTSTRYYPRLEHPYLHFDFLFSDVEVVSFHKERGYVGPLRTYDGEEFIGECFKNDSLSLNIRRHRNSFYPGEQLHAVPLLYGFNEIIVRADNPLAASDAAREAKVEPPPPSYSAFDLPTLLGRGRRVGLWGWWVVTFPIILLAHATAILERNREAGTLGLFPGLKEADIVSVRTFSDWVMTSAKESPQQFGLCIGVMVDSILEEYRGQFYPVRPLVIRSLETLTNDLSNGDLDVVIGGTSAVLATCRETQCTYEAIIPREGVFTWINCICPTPNADADFLAEIIKHWSLPDTQLRLSLGIGLNDEVDPSALSKQKYVGIPANRTAEQIFRERARTTPQLYPIHETLQKLETRRSGRDTSWLRPFPQEQAAFLMEYYWNVLTQGLKADYRR